LPLAKASTSPQTLPSTRLISAPSISTQAAVRLLINSLPSPQPSPLEAETNVKNQGAYHTTGATSGQKRTAQPAQRPESRACSRNTAHRPTTVLSRFPGRRLRSAPRGLRATSSGSGVIPLARGRPIMMVIRSTTGLMSILVWWRSIWRGLLRGREELSSGYLLEAMEDIMEES
jgi:hypothetical protein